jgi:hypothetical protein
MPVLLQPSGSHLLKVHQVCDKSGLQALFLSGDFQQFFVLFFILSLLLIM